MKTMQTHFLKVTVERKIDRDSSLADIDIAYCIFVFLKILYFSIIKDNLNMAQLPD